MNALQRQVGNHPYLPALVRSPVVGVILGDVGVDARERQLLVRRLRDGLHNQLRVGERRLGFVLEREGKESCESAPIFRSEHCTTCLEGDGDDVEETSTVEATAGGGGCGGGGAVRLLIPPAAAETGTPLVEMTGTPVTNEMYYKHTLWTYVQWSPPMRATDNSLFLGKYNLRTYLTKG